MKFLLIALIALCAFTFPASAQSIVWEGKYGRATQQGGVWMVNDPRRGPTLFAHCETRNGEHGNGIYCHSRVDGDADAVGNDRPDVTTQGTPYAVFNPRNYQRYVPQGRGNIWNLDSEPQMRQACQNAGGNCVIVIAPAYDWQAAVAIAKRQTGWRL